MNQKKFEDVHNYNCDEKQLKQIEQFQIKISQIIQKNYSTVNEDLKELYSNVDTAVRFLNAREFNEAKAFEMWEKWVKWHTEYRPDLISDKEPIIQKQLSTGKLFWHKFDKDRRPCLYYRMKYHVPNLASVDESVRFFLFMLEQGINEGLRLGSEGTICVIYDRRGYTKSKYDENAMKTMRALVPILQDYYPERLSRFYVLGANWFYRAAFKVVATFMSEKTSDKVRVLADDIDLLEFFNKQNLIKEYGGDSDPLQTTGANLKLNSGSYKPQKGDDDIDDMNDCEDEEEDDEHALKELQKKMFQDAGVKLS